MSRGVIKVPPMQFPFNPNADAIREAVAALPPGRIAIVANDSARHTVFTGNMLGTVCPNGSGFSIHTGCYVVDSCNRSYNDFLDTTELEWIMLMGDDHQWPPWMLLKLVALMEEQNLDIIAPLCFKRDFPPTPVVYMYQEATEEVAHKYAYDPKEARALYPIDLTKFPEGGVIEVDAVGSAGMIVRRKVLEALERPFFRLGESQWGEDLDFCRRAQQAGFKIHVDLDLPLGHIVYSTIWPVRDSEGNWFVRYDFTGQGGFQLAL